MSDLINSLATAAPVKLLDQFGRYIEGRVPTNRETKPLRRLSPTYIDASTLDVEIIHNILSNSDVGDARQLLALYDQIIFSDSHIQGELAKRKLAVLGDPWKATAVDKKNPEDVAAAALVQAQLEACGSFFDARSHMLDSCIWPVTVVEKTYRRSSRPGLKFEMDEFIAVPHFMLYLDPNGPLRIFDVMDGTVCGTHHMADPLRYVVHRGHLLGDRDHRGGPMRSLVFWWIFSAFDRDWWVRFLDRCGTPFPVGKYDQADDEARAILVSAFSMATRLGGLVISNETEVELHEVQSKSSGDAFDLFFDLCQKEKSKLIVGQTTSASSRGGGGGMNSGIGEAQSEVRDDIRRFDQLRLADTIKSQIVDPFLLVNGIVGCVKIEIGAEAVEDTEKTAESIQQLYQAGIELDDAGIVVFGERMGLALRRAAKPAAPGAGADRTPGGLSANHLATLAASIAADPRLLLADAANARVARAGSADLARAFGEDFAPLRELLTLSTSAEDFERRVRDAFPHLAPRKTVPLLENALAAYAANGLP
jgi:phage gp29-like protein